MKSYYFKSIIVLAVLLISSCTMPQPVMDAQFTEQAEFMEVTNRQGWRIRQKMGMGPYQTSRVKRGWTKSYNIPFFVNFSGSSEKLSFTLYDDPYNPHQAEVYCIGKIRQQDISWFNTYFGVILKYDHTFSGSIVLNEEVHWDFFVNEPLPNFFRRDEVSFGRLKSANKMYTIEGINRATNGKREFWYQDGMIGYAVYDGNRKVAVFSPLNRGKAWMARDISDEERIVIAALGSALMLRSDLRQSHDEIQTRNR